MISRVTLATLIVFVATGAFAAQSRLTGIRYNISGSNSKVTLLFTSSILYSASRTPDGVTLMLRNTEIGSPPGEAHLNFKSGNVRLVAVKRIGSDSASIAIVLRNPGRVEYSSSESSHALFIDVTGTAPAISEAAAKRQNHVRVSASRRGAADMPAHAVEKTVSVAQLASPSSPVPPPGDETSTGAIVMVMLFSVIIGGIGTLGTLWLYIRRTNGHDGRKENVAEPLDEVQTLLTLPRPAQPAQERHAPAPVEPETDQGPSLSLAERFQRSRGEIDFVLHLSSGAYGNNRGKKLEHADPASLTVSQRAIVAKRLGVGQGEVELMAKISRMKQRGAEEQHD
jgi:hypothetical protein